MRALLAELGDPQRAYPGDPRRRHERQVDDDADDRRRCSAPRGCASARYTSPHVAGWGERIRIDGDEADFERAIARVRPAAERLGATQFEALTAAALAEFADAGVDVAVVEAGLGGRLDATNVLDAPVVVLTNVALEHTDVLGETREAIAAREARRRAAGRDGRARRAGVGAARAPDGGRAWSSPARQPRARGAAARRSSAGRSTPRRRRVAARPARARATPLEIWDGAHNLDGRRLARRRGCRAAATVVVCSILADKDVEAMLARSRRSAARASSRRASSNPRALPAEELADAGSRYFAHVEMRAGPASQALAPCARGSGEPVLVTGSLYLLADLAAVRPDGVPWRSSATS